MHRPGAITTQCFDQLCRFGGGGILADFLLFSVSECTDYQANQAMLRNGTTLRLPLFGAHEVDRCFDFRWILYGVFEVVAPKARRDEHFSRRRVWGQNGGDHELVAKGKLVGDRVVSEMGERPLEWSENWFAGCCGGMPCGYFSLLILTDSVISLSLPQERLLHGDLSSNS